MASFLRVFLLWNGKRWFEDAEFGLLKVRKRELYGYGEIPVDCPVGEAPCLTASDDGDLPVVEAKVVYRGLCPDCLPAQSS